MGQNISFDTKAILPAVGALTWKEIEQYLEGGPYDLLVESSEKLAKLAGADVAPTAQAVSEFFEALSAKEKEEIDQYVWSRFPQSKFTSLEVDFSGKEYSVTEIKILVALLKTNKSVKVLNLASNHIDAKGAKIVASLFDAKSSTAATVLEVLNLNDNPLGDEGVKVIGEALANNTTLTSLHLAETEIKDAGAISLAGSAVKTSNLKFLDLHNNKFESKGSAAIAQALLDNSQTKMAHLNLHQNAIGDDTALLLAKFLSSATCPLVSLNLDNRPHADNAIFEMHEVKETKDGKKEVDSSMISDIGAKALATGLKTNVTLEELHLENNNISDDGAQAFAEALAVNKGLLFLAIEANHFTVQGEAVLAMAQSQRREREADAVTSDGQPRVPFLVTFSSILAEELEKFQMAMNPLAGKQQAGVVAH